MLITIEGIDGAGKSTIIGELRDTYPDAVFTREPDDTTRYGQYVRDVIADDEAPPMTVFFAFLADHAAHVAQTVRPALDQDRLVICDRYIDSRYAYQTSELDGLVPDPFSFIQSIQEAGWSRFPDLTLLIDITPTEAMRRIGGRGESSDRFEKEDSLEEKRAIYLNLAEQYSDRFVVIDGMQSTDDAENKRLVADECIAAIEQVQTAD